MYIHVHVHTCTYILCIHTYIHTYMYMYMYCINGNVSAPKNFVISVLIEMPKYLSVKILGAGSKFTMCSLVLHVGCHKTHDRVCGFSATTSGVAPTRPKMRGIALVTDCINLVWLDKNIYPEVHEPALSIHLYGYTSTSTWIRNTKV